MAGAVLFEGLEKGWDALSLGVVSSNQVGRTDWTPMGLAELAVLILSLRRLGKQVGSSMPARKL